MEFQFKKDVSLEERKKTCNSLMINKPNKIPIILEKDPKCKLKPIGKTKFLIQKDFTANHFMKMIRALMNIPDTEALFLTAKGKYSITGEKLMSQIYKDYKDKQDGFLYITYTTEIVYE